jgi:transcription elongation GreA/GreB family factor
MSIYVISAQDRDRLNAFFRIYRPFLHSEVEQIGILKKKLSDAVIVPESNLARTIVTMYTTADIVDLNRRETRRYTLVYPQYAGPGRGLLSVLSPLGAALLGRDEGSIFELTTDEGTVKFAVREILYQPLRDMPHHHGEMNGMASS